MLDLNKLKICEFNVENLFVHMDMYCGEELQTMSEDAWKALTVIQFQRKQKPLFKIFGVAKAILDIDPDILMLCEVGGLESLENFNQYFLGNKYDIYFEESNSIRTIDLAYLVRKGLPVVCSIKTNKDEALIVNQYTKSIHSKFGRDVCELHISTQESNVPALILLLVHLKSQISSNQDMKGRLFREAEVKGLIAIYQRLQSQYSVPIIIGGDFNADIKSDEFKRLTQLKLVNLHDLLQSNEEEKTTLVYFNYEEVPSNNQIDYFLIPQSLLAHVDKTESYTYRYKGFYDIPNDLPKTLTERYGMPSDHYPTVLTLILNKN